jgi:hypothetical protein
MKPSPVDNLITFYHLCHLQAASKPLPPWLMSAYKQQQQHSHPQEQQQDASADDAKAGVAKAEPLLGLEPEPDSSLAVKEEVKPEYKQVGLLLLMLVCCLKCIYGCVIDVTSSQNQTEDLMSMARLGCLDHLLAQCTA